MSRKIFKIIYRGNIGKRESMSLQIVRETRMPNIFFKNIFIFVSKEGSTKVSSTKRGRYVEISDEDGDSNIIVMHLTGHTNCSLTIY